MGQNEVVYLLTFILPINHCSAQIHYWGMSSKFLYFKLPTPQAFLLKRVYSSFSGMNLPRVFVIVSCYQMVSLLNICPVQMWEVDCSWFFL